ncbi:MAG: nucleotide exchange factor GrpE [Mycoplasmatales bacterium]
MTKGKKKKKAVEEEVVIEKKEVETEVVELTKEEKLQNDLQEALDKELRLRAEFDNYKRRTMLETINASNKGKAEVFKGMLDTIDNLERAMGHECSDESYSSGIVIVYNKMIEKLQSLGLEVIDCEGIMDHNVHQAVVTDTVEGMEDDQIIEVLQKGYKMDDTLIRVAMVKVNKI